MRYILALDTAGPAAGVALLDLGTGAPAAGGERLFVRTDPLPTGHAERLMGLITAVLDEAGIAPAAIDRLAVTTGPGSFTGVRIALATARGLALALGRPAIGIGVLELIATATRAAHPGLPVVAVLDARREALYLQPFGADGSALAPPAAADLAAAADHVPEGAVLAGSGAALLAAQLAAAGRVPAVVEPERSADPGLLARLAATREPAANPPEPLYLRAPDARPQPRQAGLLADPAG
ncbi:tRNA (adenosine(37)-N6)-threonylcarbamoyltransferase complex dimerization subunit type 1 TsaB [Pseudoxanthobacter sp.]|uniref:tRNA (adenosine(37)-N6)-threonylcarbamoyltransferase complex dimerization subunit type 1 TsaB n=1 Tax=Pseudoxanthobacter sp. TaxID=1925742 RepID=UPI002FDF280B